MANHKRKLKVQSGILSGMKQELESVIETMVQDLFGTTVVIELTRPDEQFGDYATNVALQLAKQLGKTPRQIAEDLAVELRETLAQKVSEISIAGPGFLNFKLSDETLLKSLSEKPAKTLTGQKIVAEYSDPNPFKVLHAGHVYTTIVGDAIANLMQAAGGQVHRVNYGGDVGLHVGKTLWAILQELNGEYPEKLFAIPEAERSTWLSTCYVKGNTAYEDDASAKAAIEALNKRVYQITADGDHDSALARIYWTCRAWSYEAFDAFYARLGTHLEKYYPESEVATLGLQEVQKHIGTVFQESQGAVVFKGERYGLHTRVFITSQGLPTYEAKEVGLIIKKYDDYQFDRSIVVTGNEQQEYMAVALKAIEQFLPKLAAATTYMPHGMVRLAAGVKMSSRMGNIVAANDVLDITSEAIKASGREPQDTTILGAIKYAFLKNRLGGDIIYDPEESVSLEGNSGPYLQYAHARARSILAKAEHAAGEITQLEPAERSLVRKISEYPETVNKAVAELMPHVVATYLYELAQVFNRFYEHNRVLDDPRQELRLQLVEHYADTLKRGLSLLGITAPERL